MQTRDRWSSKLIFIFAAVGSAVGLGNIWRFPYLAGKYGGGAFLVPYLFMLLVMGIPLLIMEFAIGQKLQLGAVGSFKKINSKLSGIGMGAILSGFVVVTYYAVVMAWCLLYVLHALTLQWGADPKSFFFKDVLMLSGGPEQVGELNITVFLALIVVWVLIYFSVWKGIKSVSKVVAITMPLPIILLIAILIRGITLPGSIDGIMMYITPNFQAIMDPEVWSAAMSQIFYTLTLGFGVMIAYASYQHEEHDISGSAVVTALMNSGISIVAGFAVFSTLGYMSLKSGTPLDQLAASGPSLAFIVFPQALSLFPMPVLFSVFFFVMLLTLGIDSAFSLVEAFATVVHDAKPSIKRERITFWICVIEFIFGIIFTTYAGLYYLDITDHFITTYGLVGVGLFQVLAVGWIVGPETFREFINKSSTIKLGVWWNWMIKYIIPVLLLILIGSSLYQDITTPYENYSQIALFAAGWLVILAVIGISLYISFRSKDNT